MRFLRAHWLPWAWADVLLKRLLEAAAGLVGVILALHYLESTREAQGASSLGEVSGSRVALLFPLLAALFLMIRGTFRTVVHPIRAAMTGRYLDEQAVHGMPDYRGVAPVGGPTPPQGSLSASLGGEQIYPLRLGSLVTRALGFGVGSVVSVAFTVYLFIADGGWLRVFFIFVTLGVFALFLEPVLKMPKSQRIAVAISDTGLRIPDAKETVAWEAIESVLLVCIHIGGGTSAVVASAGGGNVNHVRVMRRGGDPLELVGPKARAYRFGEENDLVGGRAAYVQLARELVEWGRAKGVRVALVTNLDSPTQAELGNPALGDWSEMKS